MKSVADSTNGASGPERAVGAAGLTPDGEIIRGTDHGDVARRAAREGKVLLDADGFVTNFGRFVSQEEAFALARRAGQRTSAADRIASEDLGADAGPRRKQRFR